MTVERLSDGAVCVITASEFDSAVYTEVVPSVGTAPIPPVTKHSKDLALMRRIYGSKA